MLVGIAVPSTASGIGTNWPHPNHIMTDFFIKTIVPTIPLSSPGSERVVSGSSQEDQTAAGSETANDTVSSLGASCCTILLEAVSAAAVASVMLLVLAILEGCTRNFTNCCGKSILIVPLSHHCERWCVARSWMRNSFQSRKSV